MACYLFIDHSLQKRDAVSQTDKILQSSNLHEGDLILGVWCFSAIHFQVLQDVWPVLMLQRSSIIFTAKHKAGLLPLTEMR